MRTDPIAKLEAAAGAADFSDTTGADLSGVRDAMSLINGAASTYVAEIDAINREWAHLMPGAADHRRTVASKAFDDALATGRKMGQALLDDAITKLEDRSLPKPPRDAGEHRLLRDEWQMLATTGNGADLAATALTVATGPRRDLASVVFTPWFTSLAATRGGINAKTLASIRAAAVEASADLEESTDRERTAARRARSLRREGFAALTAAHSAARARVDAAGRNSYAAAR